ncbi:MAG TPA: hypothetical protein VID47_04140 [Actinomycetota bacterium]|jgi:hypothetical protein
MGEFTEQLERLAGREAPGPDALDRTLRRFERRRRRRRVGGVLVGLGATIALVAGVLVIGSEGGGSPVPGGTGTGSSGPRASSVTESSPASNGGTVTYDDPAGWSVAVPDGWTVTPFFTSHDGDTAWGAEISNVTPIAVGAMPRVPVQAVAHRFPDEGLALVVGVQPRLEPDGPAADLPISYPDGWAMGSALAGSPTLGAIWFRGGSSTFVATVKSGPDVARADIEQLTAIVESIRDDDAATPSPIGTTMPGNPGTPVWAQIVLPTFTMPAGSSAFGEVVVHNGTGHALNGSGCGSPFAVALGNDRITPDVGWNDCLMRITIPAGVSSWPVTVRASYLGCDNGSSGDFPACVDGHVPPLPPGEYVAGLYQLPTFVPDPSPVPVKVTP